MSITPEASRHEWTVVLVLTIAGAALRLAGFGKLGLSHFDEGVYALAGLWSLDSGGLAALDPGLIPYAPPGYPILVGWAYQVFGVADLSAIAVSIACGVLSIPAAAWIARRSFGPGAGAFAAALAALSLMHIVFSRKALTDAPLVLAWLAAIGLGQRFLERPGLARAASFGLAVGIAQNLKYNGWLAGAVVALAAALGPTVDADQRRTRELLRIFGLIAFAAAVAALVYAPWYRFVEAHGGYASLLRHHRGYVRGPSAWLADLGQQLGQASALSGSLLWGFATWPLAWVAAALAAAPGRLPSLLWSRVGLRFRLILMLGSLALGLVNTLPWWAGLACVYWLLRDPRPARRVVGVWWLVLSILTPLYHPYARLWLPLVACGWIVLAAVAAEFLAYAQANGGPATSPVDSVRTATRRGMFLAGCLGGVIVVAFVQQLRNEPHPFALRELYGPTSALRDAVDDVIALPKASGIVAPWERGVPLRVLARRPVAFYLVTRSRVPVQLQSGVEQLSEPGDREQWALVDDVQLAQQSDALEARIQLLKDPQGIWTLFPASPSGPIDPVTLLDVEPAAAFEPLPRPPHRFELMLLRPGRGVARRAPAGTLRSPVPPANREASRAP